MSIQNMHNSTHTMNGWMDQMNNTNIITKTIMDVMVEWWDEMHSIYHPIDENNHIAWDELVVEWDSPFDAKQHMDNVHASLDCGEYDVPQCMYIHQFMHHLNNDDVIVDPTHPIPNGYAPINPQMAHYVWGQLTNSFIGMDYAIVNDDECDSIESHVESMIMGLFSIALKHGGICIKQ